MKTSILLSLLLAGSAFASFEKWNSADGRTTTLDLISVKEMDGEKVGTFKMRNGRTTTLKTSQLSEDDAVRLKEWKSAAELEAEAASPESIFDDILEGNLVRLDGKSVKKCSDATQPKKYYVFYYTASWCGPCQKFTPSLVDFYKQHKTDNFEIILITSDGDKGAMEGYAKNKKMPWPMLKLSKANDFKKKFDHGVTGIPSVIVCTLDGEKLGNYRDLNALEKRVKD